MLLAGPERILREDGRKDGQDKDERTGGMLPLL